MQDQQIIQYAKARYNETAAKTPEAAALRHAVMALPVILLRDEGGLSWENIANELDISHRTAKRIYEGAVR